MPILPPFSRRNLLRGAAVVATYVFSTGNTEGLAETTPANASASSNPIIDANDLNVATSKYFDPNWSSEGVASFPVRVPLSARSTELDAMVRWDPRLFAVHPPVSAIMDAVVEIEPSQVGAGVMEFHLPAAVTEIGVQVEVLSNYPADNIADVIPTSLTLHSGETLIDELILHPTLTSCAPWSVEATVDWVCRGSVIVPGAITLISRGPNPAPAFLEFTVQYADVAGIPALATPTDDPPVTFSADSADGFTNLVIRSRRELPPDNAVDLTFPVDFSDSRPRAFEEIVPRLQLTIPENTVGMRESGRLSSFPVTSSGSQESSYIPAPTA